MCPKIQEALKASATGLLNFLKVVGAFWTYHLIKLRIPGKLGPFKKFYYCRAMWIGCCWWYWYSTYVEVA